MEKLNYEQDLRIDENDLDIECLDQAPLFMRYAKHSAEMQKDVANAKQQLDIIKSETDKDIRENPSKYGLEKITDKAIEAVILTDEECKEGFQLYLKIKFEADCAKYAVEAMQERKDMLEQLIKLNGQSYFAGPSVPRDLSKERKLRQGEVDSKIALKMERKK